MASTAIVGIAQASSGRSTTARGASVGTSSIIVRLTPRDPSSTDRRSARQVRRAHQRAIMSYAVIRTGGKQYRVEPGTTLRIEKLEADVGATVDFPDVLLTGDGDAVRIGTPLVEGAVVRGQILAHDRDKKVLIFKKKRRKNYRRRRGHRQSITTVRVTEIA
jgi:large subunit ribosomal protein L21